MVRQSRLRFSKLSPELAIGRVNRAIWRVAAGSLAPQTAEIRRRLFGACQGNFIVVVAGVGV